MNARRHSDKKADMKNGKKMRITECRIPCF